MINVIKNSLLNVKLHTFREDIFAGTNFQEFFCGHFSGINFQELGFTEELAEINFR